MNKWSTHEAADGEKCYGENKWKEGQSVKNIHIHKVVKEGLTQGSLCRDKYSEKVMCYNFYWKEIFEKVGFTMVVFSFIDKNLSQRK